MPTAPIHIPIHIPTHIMVTVSDDYTVQRRFLLPLAAVQAHAADTHLTLDAAAEEMALADNQESEGNETYLHDQGDQEYLQSVVLSTEPADASGAVYAKEYR